MHSPSQNPWSGTTGHQFEEEFINVALVKVTWHGLYMPYQPSMSIVRRNQPANSALNAEGQKFRGAIAQEMKISPDELAIYGSIQTCLDIKHGVDLFIDWRGVTVTVDLTMNSNKDEHKADIIVTPGDIENGFALAAERVAWAFRQASRPSLRAS